MPSGDNGDQHDFAQMDRDLEDETQHARHRQYSTNLGRWQSPDLYSGSYDLTNPQSFNRYAYVLNDPANLVDPSGLEESSDDILNNIPKSGGDTGEGGGGGGTPTPVKGEDADSSSLGSAG
jgi:RHS repeat-associated protein